MQLEHLQTCPRSQLILQGYEDTRKVCRKRDIHGRMTEGHMLGNEINLRLSYLYFSINTNFTEKKSCKMVPVTHKILNKIINILYQYIK